MGLTKTENIIHIDENFDNNSLAEVGIAPGINSGNEEEEMDNEILIMIGDYILAFVKSNKLCVHRFFTNE